MNKSYEVALNQAKRDLQHSLGLNQKYGRFQEDVEQCQFRVDELVRLWEQYKELPHFQAMAKLVDEHVERYHQDFYFHDLKLIEAYKGERIAWFVGDCGTHIVFLDQAENIRLDAQKDMLNAVLHSSYSSYPCYLVNTKDGSVKPVNPQTIEFRETMKAA